jgi:hypothetical protein
MSPNTHTIHISELEQDQDSRIVNFPHEMVYVTHKYNRPYVRQCTIKYATHRVPQDNLYLNMVQKNSNYAFDHSPNIGVSSDDFDRIDSYVQDAIKGGQKKVPVFFDFDRTLSQIEGMLYLPNESYVKDAALFLFGPERINMLRERMSQLERLGANIYILTSNVICIDEKRSWQLLSIIREILPKIHKTHIICASQYKGIKGIAIKELNPILKAVMEMEDMEDMEDNQVSHFSHKIRKSTKKSRKLRKSVKKSRKLRKSVKKSRKLRKSVKKSRKLRKSVKKSRKINNY